MSLIRLCLFVLIVPCCINWVGATDLPNQFFDHQVAALTGSGSTGSVGFEFLPDGRALIAVQLSSEIHLWREGFGGAVLVSTVPGVSTAGPEEGLVGLVVDPDWPEFPYVYVHFTAVDSTVRVRRYRVTGALSDPAGLLGLANPYDVLVTPNQSINHNGGTLEFGEDKMLFVSLGDDQDPCAAQDSSSLIGVVCRLNVLALPPGAGGPPPRSFLVPFDNPFLGSGGDEELVFCFGLRNPFRFCVHPQTGSLLIGDVGHAGYEEINEAFGGENFGWPFREGFNLRTIPGCTEPGGMGSQSYDSPTYTYPWESSAAVVGGVVYEPQGGIFDFPPEYDGAYFFSDYVNTFIRVLEAGVTGWALMDSVPGQPNAEDWGANHMFVSDWELGSDGALYYMLQYSDGYRASTAELHRIVYASGSIGVRNEILESRMLMWPNPAHAGRRVWGETDKSTTAIDIYNLRGVRIRTLALDPGATLFSWDGRDRRGQVVSPGVYWARSQGEKTSTGQKIIILP
jgi:glucose/arabinose dehydrogenase